MKIAKILKDSGYKISEKLNNIIITEPELNLLSKEVDSADLSDPLNYLAILESVWERIVQENSNYLDWLSQGKKYAVDSKNPTLEQFCEEASQYFKENINNLFEQKEQESKAPSDAMLRMVENFVRKVATGYILGPRIQYLKQNELIVRTYLHQLPFGGSYWNTFKDHLEWIQAIVNVGINPLHSLKDLVIRNNQSLITLRIEEFENIRTPSRQRTIEDSLNEINLKLKEGKEKGFWSKNTENFYRGYQFAIRGQNPTVWQLTKESGEFFKNPNEDTSLFTRNISISQISKENVRITIDNILDGYISSHFQVYLESQITKEKAGKEITPPEAKQKTYKVRWAGQKNQMYDLIRNLKADDLIHNSYEELAVILKENIDVFEHTALSTIQKELGKAKALPKQKRIDSKKMITPKDTP